MGPGALETLKQRSTFPHPAPAWALAPVGALVWLSLTHVEWPQGSGSGTAGPRDVAMLPHCSDLPGVNPGLFQWLVSAAVRANLDPGLDLGIQVDL